MPFLLIGVVFSFARVRRVFFADIGRFSERARLWRRVSRILAGLFVLMILAGWSWLAFGWLTAERWLTENGAGEPISVFEGISIWPTIALRTFGVLLALFLTWYTVHDLQASARDTLTRFNESEDDRSFGEIWLNLRTRRRLCWADAFRAVVWFPPMKNTGPYQHEDDAREEMAFKAYALASGDAKCCGRGGKTVLEQIANMIRQGDRSDRISPLPDRISATASRMRQPASNTSLRVGGPTALSVRAAARAKHGSCKPSRGLGNAPVVAAKPR